MRPKPGGVPLSDASNASFDTTATTKVFGMQSRSGAKKRKKNKREETDEKKVEDWQTKQRRLSGNAIGDGVDGDAFLASASPGTTRETLLREFNDECAFLFFFSCVFFFSRRAERIFLRARCVFFLLPPLALSSLKPKFKY